MDLDLCFLPQILMFHLLTREECQYRPLSHSVASCLEDIVIYHIRYFDIVVCHHHSI